MSSNPTSFRLPFALPEEVHPAVRDALRLTYQGVADLNQAIAALVPKVNANTASSTTVNQTITAAISASGGGGGSAAPVFGNVNLQPNRTAGSYQLSQSDLGGLILVNSSVAFALALNSGLTVPFFTTIFNFGAGLITETPSAGLVNNVASLPIPQNQFAIVFFDGANWWSVSPTTSAIGINFSDGEVVNFAGTAFTLLNAPNPAASLILMVDLGVLAQGAGKDYTLSANAGVFATAPRVGANVIAWYRY